MNVCDLSNRIGSYASGGSSTIQTMYIDAVDVQANHGSFTTLTVNGTDVSGEFSDVTEKTQYMDASGGETTFLSHVVVPTLEISSGTFSVANVNSTTLTATNILTPDEFTSMKIGSATKNMISLAPGSTQVGIHTALPSYPLDITGTMRISAPTTSTTTQQMIRAFVPNLATTTNEAQILFGISASTRKAGVLSWTNVDATTTTNNKLSLYNFGTTTPRLEMDSNNIAITGKFKSTGCTTDSPNAAMLSATPTTNNEFLIPLTATSTLACRKFRISFLDVTTTISPYILFGNIATGYDVTASTYQRVITFGNHAGSVSRGNTDGFMFWNTPATPNPVSGSIQFEFVGTFSSRQVWSVNGKMSDSTNATPYYTYISGTVVMPSAIPVLMKVKVTNATGSLNITYDA
jgi:hypothetical protein